MFLLGFNDVVIFLFLIVVNIVVVFVDLCDRWWLLGSVVLVFEGVVFKFWCWSLLFVLGVFLFELDGWCFVFDIGRFVEDVLKIFVLFIFKLIFCLVIDLGFSVVDFDRFSFFEFFV